MQQPALALAAYGHFVETAHQPSPLHITAADSLRFHVHALFFCANTAQNVAAQLHGNIWRSVAAALV